MAIKREQKYVYKIDTGYPDAGAYFVGGSPIAVEDEEIVPSGAGTGKFSGVAANNHKLADETGKVTVIKTPYDLIIQKDADESNTFDIETDDYYPWDASLSYSVGDLLKPGTKSDGGHTWLVWTNNTSADDFCYAKVNSISGGPAGDSITEMKIELGIWKAS